MDRSTLRLGELLLRKELVTPRQLEDALRQQQQQATKEYIGEILVRNRVITEDQLFETLAEQFGIPYGHLNLQTIDWTVARHFSPSLLKDHYCFPIRMDQATMTVAIANPLDAWAIGEVERLAGHRVVKWVLAPAREIQQAIQRLKQEMLKSLDVFLKKQSSI